MEATPTVDDIVAVMVALSDQAAALGSAVRDAQDALTDDSRVSALSLERQFQLCARALNAVHEPIALCTLSLWSHRDGMRRLGEARDPAHSLQYVLDYFLEKEVAKRLPKAQGAYDAPRRMLDEIAAADGHMEASRVAFEALKQVVMETLPQALNDATTTFRAAIEGHKKIAAS